MAKITDKNRLFQIIKMENSLDAVFKGEYRGRPSQAAKKAFTKYCKGQKLEDCQANFSIKEVTPDSKGKEFHYLGKRSVLDKPKKISRGQDSFDIKYEVTVKKIK